MDSNNSIFDVSDLTLDSETCDQNSDTAITSNNEHDYGEYLDYCSECSDIYDFMKLTSAMVEEINELRAEVVRWRQAMIKYLPERWADGLKQDIFDNLYLNVYEDYEAYNYYVKRCCNGKDPFDNKQRSKFMERLSKGTDDTSITYL